MKSLRKILIVVAVFCFSTVGLAQSPPAAVSPYDPSLMRLSEVLGSIHYLRALCGANEGNIWRDKMNEIIAAEEPTPLRHAQMIARFNHGYRSFETIYRNCTPSALLAADRYVKEGVRLSSQITTRFGR